MNELKQIKTIQLQTSDGPAYAILLALDVNDVTTTREFVNQVLEKFKMQWMIGPPQTTHLLVTLIGDLSAIQFVEIWQEKMVADPVLKTIMSLMKVADVRRGSDTGVLLEEESLFQAV